MRRLSHRTELLVEATTIRIERVAREFIGESDWTVIHIGCKDSFGFSSPASLDLRQ